MPEPADQIKEEEVKISRPKRKTITSKYQHSFPNILEEVNSI
jgi:hypothetical protein